MSATVRHRLIKSSGPTVAREIGADGLVLDQVSKRYRSTTAVDGVSFDVPRGQVFGLLGNNGAGKTTTVRMILDLLRPDSGRITWSGKPVAQVPKSQVGYLPEERGLHRKMPVAELLIFLARVRGMDAKGARTAARDGLERLGIGQHATSRVEQLSKGNQQLVQFLGSVLHEPELVVLDEPFSGLDPVNQALIERELEAIGARGATVILSSHNMEQVEKLCGYVALINRSRLLFQGPLSELKRTRGDAGYRLRFQGDARAFRRSLHGVETTWLDDDTLQFPGAEPWVASQVLERALRHGRVLSLEPTVASLRQIFIDMVTEGAAQ